MQPNDFASLSDLEVIWSDHGGTCPIPTRILIASDLLLSIGPSPDREFDQSFQRISGALVLAYGDPLYSGGLRVINEELEPEESQRSHMFSSKHQGTLIRFVTKASTTTKMHSMFPSAILAKCILKRL